MFVTPRIANLLISIMTFLLGLGVANFVAATSKLDPAYPFNKAKTCVSMTETEDGNQGPGSEVYRARQERILEIDQELRDLPELHARIAQETGLYCVTAASLGRKHLERERELMVELLKTADQNKPVHFEVCY